MHHGGERDTTPEQRPSTDSNVGRTHIKSLDPELQSNASYKDDYLGSILSGALDTSQEGESKTQWTRSATPIIPSLTSITHSRPKKAGSTAPTKMSLQVIQDVGSESSVAMLQNTEKSTQPSSISLIKEDLESREKQSFKPKGGVPMFQSKELFQAISLRQTNQNNTIRDNLRSIEEQRKQESRHLCAEERQGETGRSMSLTEPHISQQSTNDRHAYVSWAPSELETPQEGHEEMTPKSPVSVSTSTSTIESTTVPEFESDNNGKKSKLSERTHSKTICNTKETIKPPISQLLARGSLVTQELIKSAHFKSTQTADLAAVPETRECDFYETSESETKSLIIPNDLCFLVSNVTHKVNVNTLNLEEGILTKSSTQEDIAKNHVETLETVEGIKLPFVKKLYKILGNTWFCCMRINLDEKAIAINGVYVLVTNPHEIYICIGINNNMKKQEYAYDVAKNQFVAIDYPKAVIDTLGLTSPLFWQYVDLQPPPFITDHSFRPVDASELAFDETDESERTFITRARLFGWRRGFEDGAEEEIFESPFSIACMNIYSILVLVTRKDVYIWFESLDLHKRPATVAKIYQFAKKIFNDISRPEFSSIIVCSSGDEPFHFRKFFVDWPCETVVSKEIYRLIGTFAAELEHDLPRFPSIGSIEERRSIETLVIQQMWHIVSSETFELVSHEQMNFLFSGAVYLFVVRVVKREEIIENPTSEASATFKRYYRWIGMGAFLKDKGKSHEKPLHSEFSDAELVNIKEGQEPSEFLSLFPEGFVCLFGEHRDATAMTRPFPSGAIRVIQISSYQSDVVRAFQIVFGDGTERRSLKSVSIDGETIDTKSWSAILPITHTSEKASIPIDGGSSDSLSAISCYIFELAKKVYLWVGVGSWDSERLFARSLAEKLTRIGFGSESSNTETKSLVMVNQFQEPSNFIEDIHVKIGNIYPSNMIATHRKDLEHAASMDQESFRQVVYTTSIPKVFKFSLKHREDCSIPNDISDIKLEKLKLPLHAVNLESDSIYLNDTGDEWVLWIGSKTQFNYRQMRFIYISTTVLSRHFPSTLPTTRAIMVTCESHESQSFKAGLIGWNYRRVVSEITSSKKPKNNWLSKIKSYFCSTYSGDDDFEQSKHKKSEIVSLPLVIMMQKPRTNFYSYKDLKNIKEYHLYGGGSTVDTFSPRNVQFMDHEEKTRA